MKLQWYKRFPENALAGMKPLSLEERGAYNTVLDLIYFLGGDLDDDDHFIAGWCSCDVRIWKRIKVRLLALGKIYIAGGKLCNARADVVLASAIAKTAATSYAGQQSAIIKAAKSAAKRRKNNNMAATDVATDGQHQFQPFLEDRDSNLTVTDSGRDAASASASPDGPPRPQLPDTAKWSERLNGYRPWEGKSTWLPFWGPRPDSLQRPSFIPPEMHKAWLIDYEAAKARGEAA